MKGRKIKLIIELINLKAFSSGGLENNNFSCEGSSLLINQISSQTKIQPGGPPSITACSSCPILMTRKAITMPQRAGGKSASFPTFSSPPSSQLCVIFRAYWGDIVDGIFSWEANWPARVPGYGGNYPGDVSPDVVVQKGAIAHGKLYMIGTPPKSSPLAPPMTETCVGASALQYKDSVSQHPSFPYPYS